MGKGENDNVSYHCMKFQVDSFSSKKDVAQTEILSENYQRAITKTRGPIWPWIAHLIF